MFDSFAHHRGVLLPSFVAWMPTPMAVILDSALFAAGHMNGGGSPVTLARQAGVGAVLGVSHLASKGNLLVPTMQVFKYSKLCIHGVCR